MDMTQKDCQTEVTVVFEKLNFWKEAFSKIIESHSKSIATGVNDLVVKVSDLHNELLSIKEERDVLLQTVDKQNGEIRELKTMLHMTPPIPGEEEHMTQKNQEVEMVEELDSPVIHNETDTLEVGLEVGDTGNLNIQVQKEEPLNDDYNVEILQTNKELTEYTSDTIVDKDTDQRNINTLHATCNQCKVSFSTNESLQSHLQDVHSNLDKIEITVNSGEELKEGGKSQERSVMYQKLPPRGKMKGKQKCPQCTYETSYYGSMNRHIREVHDKVRNHKCDECGFATSQKGNLRAHLASVHNICERWFKCQLCAFKTHAKFFLIRHMESGAHNNHNEKNLIKCEQCPFMTKFTSTFKRHVEGVHKYKIVHELTEKI